MADLVEKVKQILNYWNYYDQVPVGKPLIVDDELVKIKKGDKLGDYIITPIHINGCQALFGDDIKFNFLHRGDIENKKMREYGEYSIFPINNQFMK